MTVTVSSAPAGTITVQPGDRTPASIVIKTFNIENATTSEVPEGVNLYFSNARAVAALTAGQSITIDANGRINSSATSSSNYSDSNTYANVSLIGYATTTNVALKANIVDLTTANVAELTNLYYTNARVYSNVTTLGYITSSALSGYATNTQLASYATNAQLSSYATTTNVALKANVIDLTTATYGFRTGNANAIIYTSAGDWVFTANGTVILPGGGKINTYDSGSVDLVAGSSETSAGLLSNNTLNLIKVDNNGAYIATTDSLNTTWEWNFGTNGSTQFPNSTLFNTSNLKILAPNVTLQSTGAVTVQASQGIPSEIGSISGYSGNWNLNPRTNLPTTVYYGLGTGLTVTIVESGGVPSGVIIVNPGSGYENGQSVSVTSGNASISFSIIVPAIKNWTFGTDGNLTVPGNIILNSYSVGYLEAPQNSQNTSYTLTLTDSGKHIYSQNTATQVVTIPTNANVAFNVGTMVSIVLQGSGNVTVSPFSGVTLYLAGNSTSASRTISTYGMATLMKVATNTWFINGSGVS